MRSIHCKLIGSVVLVGIVSLFLMPTIFAALESLDFAPLVRSGIYSGRLTQEDEVDYYKIHLKEADVLDIRLAAQRQQSSRYTLPIYLHGKVEVMDYTTHQNIFMQDFSSEDDFYAHLSAPKESYYIIAITRTAYEGSYTLEIAIKTANDANSNHDASADQEAALEINPGNYTGSLAEGDDKDNYKVRIKKGDLLIVTAQAHPLLTLEVTAVAGDYIDPTVRAMSQSGKSAMTTTALGSSSDDGWALMSISRLQGEGDYTFNLEIQPQNDAELQEDAPESIAEAKEIQFGTHHSFLGGADRSDYYRFYPHGKNMLLISAQPSHDISLRLKLYNLNTGELVTYEEGRKGQVREVTLAVEDDGYVVGVEAYEGSGSYELSIGAPGEKAVQNQTLQTVISSPLQTNRTTTDRVTIEPPTNTTQIIVVGSIVGVVLVGLLIGIIYFLRRY